ncbi:MAG: hypothetical protein JWQ49_4332 [Edaphobacter sp.]|nr:hypothetical protein [Edaphobacter sp.]
MAIDFPEAHRRLWTGALDRAQRDAVLDELSLVGRKWFARYPTLSMGEREDILQEATWRYARAAYLGVEGEGSWKAIFLQIMKTRNIDAWRRKRVKVNGLTLDVVLTPLDDAFPFGEGPAAEVDFVDEFLCDQQNEILIRLADNWDRIPNCSWKETLRLWLDYFALEEDPYNRSAFQRYCDMRGVHIPRTNLDNHLAQGLRQLLRWIRGVDKLPDNV